MPPAKVMTMSMPTATVRLARTPRVTRVSPAEYTDRWLESSSPPKAAIR